MDIAALEGAYHDGAMTPAAVIAGIYDEIARTGERPVWISLVDREANLRPGSGGRTRIARAAALWNSIRGKR